MNRTTIFLTLTFVAPLCLLLANANAQFGGRAGPAPVPFRGMSPSPIIIPATVARQNTLPLFVPLAPQLLGPTFSRFGWGTYGGFGYYPDFAYNPGFAVALPNNSVRYNRLPFPPPPFFPPRNFAVPAPIEIGNPNTARLTLTVPSGAEVFIGGKQIELNGTKRTVESPDLRSGETFTFDVRVTWTENGKYVDERRRLSLRAGEHQSLQYLAQSSSAPLRLER